MANLFHLQGESLPPNLQVLGFHGVEEISSVFRFEVAFTAPDAFALDLKEPIGKRATLSIERLGAPPHLVHGMITRVELFHEYADHAIFIAHLGPRLARLGLDAHSRIFTDRSVPEIVSEVLRARGLASNDVEIQLYGSYPIREHVCQYKETDLAFVERLLEKEGIFYYFRHDADHEVLVLSDDRSRYGASTGTATYHALNLGDAPAEEAFATFRLDAHAMSATVTERDYDYLRPTLDVGGSANVDGGETGTSIVTFGDSGYRSEEALRHAVVRAERMVVASNVYAGWGSIHGLRSGHAYTLEGHPRASFNTSYLATRVVHQANDTAGHTLVERRLHLEKGQPYLVTVESLPAAFLFRPARKTTWPRIPGVVEGTVDGPVESRYAQLDEHGRYHVRLKLDESGLPDGKASMWIRMLQPHAGNPEGFHFPLRKHTEVHVMFVNGDPDRPVIVGAVPNPLTPSVVTSANHTQNVIMTGGSNRFELEDKEGGQYVTLSSPTFKSYLHLGAGKANAVLHTLGDGLNYYGKNLEVHVVEDKHEEVEGSLTETYRDRSQTTVYKECFKDYLDIFDMSVHKQATYIYEDVLDVHAQGAVRVHYDKTLDLTVDGAATEKLGSLSLEVVGTTLMKHLGGRRVEVTGTDYTTATGDQTLTTDANQNLVAGAAQLVSAVGSQTLKAASQKTEISGPQENYPGSHFTKTAGPFVVYSGPMFEAWSDGSFKVTAAGGDGLVSAHGQLALQASGDILETAVTILIRGDGSVNIEGGTVNIKGSVVKINS